MGWQGIIVIMIVVTACAYLVWQAVARARKAAKGGGCSCCAAECPARDLNKRKC